MTMTGKGQSLTGDDDQDVEDLVVKYTGTATGAFDFKYIKGVGEKIDRSLFYMADSTSGYVKNKQESLQNQMDNIDQKINDMEERLTKYQDSLIAKYAAMESMLAQLQAQQSWLTSQINSFSSNR
jgi:flagellar hook-associated protein 2